MDIRKDFAKVIEKYGHEIIYVRRDLRFTCSCYVERSGGQRSSFCKKCMNTGYVVSFEKRRVRRQSSSVPESLVRSRKIHDIGNVSSSAYIYYMDYKVKPKKGDLILEVEWKSGLPTQIHDRFEISMTDRMQGDNGRTEFYQVYSKYSTKGEESNGAFT